MGTLAQPDEKLSNAVDVRSELDLRIGKSSAVCPYIDWEELKQEEGITICSYIEYYTSDCVSEWSPQYLFTAV